MADLVFSTLARSVAAEGAGHRIVQVHMPHHDAEARVAIWPRGAGGTATVCAENAVFHGVEAFVDAEPAAGAFPVVLSSHGMGGTDRALAWLGTELANRGHRRDDEPPQFDLGRFRHDPGRAPLDPRRRTVEGAGHAGRGPGPRFPSRRYPDYGGHFVGLHPGGAAVLPLFGWSGVAGDLRPAHFAALHAMQALPLLRLWLDRRGNRNPARSVRIGGALKAR